MLKQKIKRRNDVNKIESRQIELRKMNERIKAAEEKNKLLQSIESSIHMKVDPALKAYKNPLILGS